MVWDRNFISGMHAYSIRGRPFQYVGKAWHFLEVNVLTSKMLKINDMSYAGKEINNLTSALLHLMLVGKGKKKKKKNSKIFRLASLATSIFTTNFAGIEFVNNFFFLLDYIKMYASVIVYGSCFSLVHIAIKINSLHPYCDMISKRMHPPEVSRIARFR